MKLSPSLMNWLLLICLVALWGTSFMFTAIAVETIDPISIVFFRVLIGALILTLALFARGGRLPHNIQAWLIFLLMGFAGNLLPFFLIAWGQQTIDSGLAGMIMAIMPLITMILAHYFIQGEDLNRYKILGFVFGISGVSLLLGPVFKGSLLEIYSGIAILIAACSYAVNAILVRLLPPFNPKIAGAGVLIAASVSLLPVWYLQPTNDWFQMSNASIISLIWLGIGPTGIATIMLFSVIERAGPTFLATINYLIPVVAFSAGVIFLAEKTSWMSLLALMIILSGISLTRFKATHNARNDKEI